MKNKLEYLPVYRYKGNKSGFFRGMFSVLVEMHMNAFGKKRVVNLEMRNVPDHRDGRGDVEHRGNGIMSILEHDAMVDRSDKMWEKQKIHGIC